MIIFCDGKCTPKNLGNLGIYCFIAYSDEGGEIAKECRHYREWTTNNENEYRALILALEWLLANADKIQDRKIEILSDSQLVINQIEGKWMCWEERLRPLMLRARALIQQLIAKGFWIRIRWVRRYHNLADELTWQYYHKIRK